MADVKIVNDQEVPVVEYDDAAIEAGYKAKRKAQIEQDCSLPFGCGTSSSCHAPTPTRQPAKFPLLPS